VIYRVAAPRDKARLQVRVIGTFHSNILIGYRVLLNNFLWIFADFKIKKLIKMCDHLICLLVLLICLKYQISPRALLLTKEDEAAEAGT
jgi:hypothetical protein